MISINPDPTDDRWHIMITLHHLAYSRSHRILWLLEEAGLPYHLVRYDRDANFKAPPALAKVHPLGKSPVIEDGTLILAESAVILKYIDVRYAGGRFSPPRDTDAYFVHEEWLEFVESTAALPIMITRIGALTGGLTERMGQFVKPVLGKTLASIATAMIDQHYLMGEAFTLADIQIAYPLEVAARMGLLDPYPPLKAYLDRLRARPAFQKAVEIGGPMLPPA